MVKNPKLRGLGLRRGRPLPEDDVAAAFDDVATKVLGTPAVKEVNGRTDSDCIVDPSISLDSTPIRDADIAAVVILWLGDTRSRGPHNGRIIIEFEFEFIDDEDEDDFGDDALARDARIATAFAATIICRSKPAPYPLLEAISIVWQLLQ